jgi:hypothetical protein
MGRRNVSTVAPQALYLMNHPFAMEQARLAAKKNLEVTDLNDAARIDRAYRTAIGRLPTESERKLALKFLSASSTEGNADTGRLDVWAEFYQVLFASMDFRYLN